MTVHPGLVVIFGSGETAPWSRKLYEWVVGQLTPPINAAVLETPAGFEPNSAQVAGRVASHVDGHLRQPDRPAVVVPARRRGTADSPDEPAVVAPLFQADLIFLGPGSPTYAARQLRGSLAWHALQARHRQGAAILFASAGAIAAGALALPVYEIYKVGADLHWQPGLDFFGDYGLKLACVPHWNNADGGRELDTSRCYMGPERFAQLRALLPAGTVIAGVDELTALVLEPEAEICKVWGVGEVTLVDGDSERRFEAGESFSIRELGDWRRPDPRAGLPEAVWDMAATRPDALDGAADDSHDGAHAHALMDRREAMRAREDWTGADRLRDELQGLGWRIEDTRDGPRLSRLSD